jgi:glycosyltransferase involved in cell wall biosynthesis
MQPDFSPALSDQRPAPESASLLAQLVLVAGATESVAATLPIVRETVQSAARNDRSALRDLQYELARNESSCPVERTTTTCIISNHNYARFVGEAIEGALRQTVPFDEIIVVDDGSTDGSLDLVETNYGRHPVVQIIGKENRGQLSCFNEGFARATGEIVFFLDADDVYEPHYVERALSVYQVDADCDFLFCARQLFGKEQRVLSTYADDRDLGYSVISTVYFRAWIGAATSCLSMRRRVLEKLLPLPFEDDWRVRADDCLVFGTSLAGARKRFLAQPLVRYRVHDRNQFRGRPQKRRATYRRRLAINRLFEFIERKRHYNVARLADFAHREFRTIERPSFRQLVNYARISMSARAPIFRRLSCAGEIAWHYTSSRRWRASTHPVTSSVDHRSAPWRHSIGDANLAACVSGTGETPHYRRAA